MTRIIDIEDISQIIGGNEEAKSRLGRISSEIQSNEILQMHLPQEVSDVIAMLVFHSVFDNEDCAEDFCALTNHLNQRQLSELSSIIGRVLSDLWSECGLALEDGQALSSRVLSRLSIFQISQHGLDMLTSLGLEDTSNISDDAEGLRAVSDSLTFLALRVFDFEDETELFLEMMMFARRILGFEYVALWKLSSEDGMLRLFDDMGTTDPAVRECAKRVGYSEGEGIPGKVWQGGSVLCERELAVYTAWERERLIALTGIGSIVALPVRRGGEFWGVIELFSDTDIDGTELKESILPLFLKAIENGLSRCTDLSQRRLNDQLLRATEGILRGTVLGSNVQEFSSNLLVKDALESYGIVRVALWRCSESQCELMEEFPSMESPSSQALSVKESSVGRSSSTGEGIFLTRFNRSSNCPRLSTAFSEGVKMCAYIPATSPSGEQFVVEFWLDSLLSLSVRMRRALCLFGGALILRSKISNS